MSANSPTTSTPRFDASRRILRYAETKLHDLESAINRHLNAEVELEAQPGIHLITIMANIKSPIPDSLGFQVVETVGHVRAALDKMISEIVISNGRGAAGAAFPFGGMGSNGTPEPFPTTRHEGLRKKLTSEQWKLVLAQAPYPGGNNTLWSVNTIANASKHGAGLVEMDANVSPQFGAANLTAYSSQVSRYGEIRKFGHVPANAKGKHRIAQLVNLKGDIELGKVMRVVFADVAPVAGEDVLVVIDGQIRLVTQVVDLFDQLA